MHIFDSRLSRQVNSDDYNGKWLNTVVKETSGQRLLLLGELGSGSVCKVTVINKLNTLIGDSIDLRYTDIVPVGLNKVCYYLLNYNTTLEVTRNLETSWRRSFCKESLVIRKIIVSAHEHNKKDFVSTSVPFSYRQYVVRRRTDQLASLFLLPRKPPSKKTITKFLESPYPIKAQLLLNKHLLITKTGTNVAMYSSGLQVLDFTIKKDSDLETILDRALLWQTLSE